MQKDSGLPASWIQGQKPRQQFVEQAVAMTGQPVMSRNEPSKSIQVHPESSNLWSQHAPPNNCKVSLPVLRARDLTMDAISYQQQMASDGERPSLESSRK